MATSPVNDNEFETKVLNSDGIVLVDFWAEWCGPCRMISPILEELSHDYEENVVVGKLNVDYNPEVSYKYGIRSIPTILFIKDGEVVDKQVGATSKQVLAAKIEAQLS